MLAFDFCIQYIILNLYFHVKNWTEEDQRQADRLLALFIGGSTLPINLTIDPNVRRFINKIAPMVSQECEHIIVLL